MGFAESILQPGEFAGIVDKHTLAFCFGIGDISYLNFDESVSEETAKELIEKIKQFIENSYKIQGFNGYEENTYRTDSDGMCD